MALGATQSGFSCFSTYPSDTPLLRAMGFLVSQHGHLGAIPPPPFLSIPPWRACEVEVRYPPSKGVSQRYLRDTCENKANGCDTPLCDTISKGYCAIWGGISHWAAKSEQIQLRNILARLWLRSCLPGTDPITGLRPEIGKKIGKM